jgi:hypothetical protein
MCELTVNGQLCEFDFPMCSDSHPPNASPPHTTIVIQVFRRMPLALPSASV